MPQRYGRLCLSNTEVHRVTKVPALLHFDNDGNRGEANILQVLAHTPPWRRNTLHRKKTKRLRGTE